MAPTAKHILRRGRIPMLFIGLLWLIKTFETVFSLNLTHGGVYPRSFEGLLGILTYPLIHGDWAHLYNNTMPLLVLGTALFYFFPKGAFRISGLIYLFSGICVWIIGSPAWHIGASGLVYGLAFFHFWNGIFSNDRKLMAISLVVVFLYGSMVWGLFPLRPESSWEGHLGGAIAGLALAYFHRKSSDAKPINMSLEFLGDYEQQSQTGYHAIRYDYREAD